MITKEITVWCDFEIDGERECFEWRQFNDYESRGGLPSYARRKAKELYGWQHTQDGHDYCPKHRKEKQ